MQYWISSIGNTQWVDQGVKVFGLLGSLAARCSSLTKPRLDAGRIVDPVVEILGFWGGSSVEWVQIKVSMNMVAFTRDS